LDGLDAVEQVQLTQLAQSNVPLECTFELYPVLLRYAQGFEQHSLFKKEMSFDKNERFTEEELGSQYRFYYQNPLHNPFRNEDVTHPVEAALMRAKIASNYEYLLTFKKERLAVIEYLEPGYQRIFGAACRLRDFVLDNKCDGGLFDVHRQYYAEDPHDGKNRQRATALVLLKEYIESFKRDMPLEIKSNIRLHQNIYNSFYSSLAINSFWQNAESAPETQDYDRFAEHYTSAVDHLDAEYLEIRQARRELFEGGLPELNFRGCDVDLELSCFDKKVDWSVNEISVVSREEEKEDFDHSDNDRNSDHQGWENDSSDDQVSVDRDSDDDIDGQDLDDQDLDDQDLDDQDLDDQDFDERESISEDSDVNDQASASVAMDQEIESISESGSDGGNDHEHFLDQERNVIEEDSQDRSGGDTEGYTPDQIFHNFNALIPSIGSGHNISESFEQSTGDAGTHIDTDLAVVAETLEEDEFGNYNWEGSERESAGSEAELPVAEQEDVDEDDERSSPVDLDNEDVSDSEDGSDSEDISDNGQDLD
jgi:hypothetical protein